jgi:hypothetical protein
MRSLKEYYSNAFPTILSYKNLNNIKKTVDLASNISNFLNIIFQADTTLAFKKSQNFSNREKVWRSNITNG